MKTWCKRGIAFLLTFAFFLPQTTALATDDQTPELPAYTSALYSTEFDQSNPDKGKIDGTNNTVSWDDPVYYVVNKSKLIGSDSSADDIQEGKVYRISLPDPLICSREINDEPIQLTSGSDVITFARVNARKGANYLEISFKIESGDNQLSWLHDIYFSFSCNWDHDKAEEMDADNDGNIQIATLPDATDVHITELEPPPPIKTTLTKTQTTSNTGETTWTVHCAIGNEAGNIPDSLVDILPDGISYVDGSAVVTTVPSDAGNGSAAQYDPITRTLTYALPVGATEATLQYKTTLTDDVITQFWQNGKVYTINNDVEARLETVVCADATCRVSYNQLKPLLQKSFKDLDYDEATGQYFVTWGVRVDCQGQTLNQLKLHDTYGAALLLPKSSTSDDVDFDALEMKIAYTDPNRPDPVIEIDANDVAIDQTAHTLVIDLAPYLSRMTGLPSQPFEVTYKMQVDKSKLEQGASKEDFRNQVYGQFQTQSMQQPAQSVLSTADLPVKTENTLVLQSGIGYDSKTRALKWKTTINPGLMATDPTLKAPNLTSVVYEDRFTKDATNPNLVGYDYQTFGLNAEAIKAQEDSIRSQIQKQIENIPGAEAKVSIEETDTDRVLRVELKGTGTASISFDYSTYILKPEHWASNASNLVFRNSVRLLKEGTEIDGIPITNDASAVSQIKVSGTILKKWPMGTYYTTDNKLQWELVLNDRNAPLGTIQVIDQLPEGMQYVPGSAKLDGQPISETNAGDGGNYVSQEGQSIIFHLNNIQAKQYRVLFTTTVDPNASVVKQNKQVRFNNQAAVKVWSESDQNWVQTATASETATLNYSVLKKDVIQTSGSDNGVREARYTVQINPLRMQLQNTSADQVVVQDTLADGLILDLDSVQLYEGITPPFKKVNPTEHVYSPIVTKGIPIETDIQFDAVQNQLQVALPKSDQAYYLTYTAYITRAGVNLKNYVRLVNTNLSDSLSNAQNSVQYNIISGGASLRPPMNKYCSLMLKKVDEASQSPLSGAEFGLYSAESEDALLAVGVSGTDGICTLSVEKSKIAGLQTLYYKEITAPDQYLTGSHRNFTELSIAQINDSVTTPIIVPNKKASANQIGRLRILRQDEDTKEPLSGAEITVYDISNDTVVISGITNLRGIVEFDGLEPNLTYRIEETTPPAGYPPMASRTIRASADPTETILENALHPVDCIIQKIGSYTGLPLGDAEFGLYQTADCSDAPLMIAKTDTTGYCKFTQLDPSKQYWVKEITPPPSYELSQTIYALNFEKGQDCSLVVRNTRSPVTLEATKLDESGKPLSGAEFMLTEDLEQHQVVGTAISGADGKIRYEGLLPNQTYYLWETKAPAGYLLNQAPTIFQTDLQSGGNLVQLTVKNELTPIRLTVQKVDDTSKTPLPGAEFRLTTDAQGTQIHETVICDTYGMAVFHNLLPDRTYYLWETKAPDGYQRPEGYVREIQTSKGQSDLSVIIENSQIRTSLVVQKVDEDARTPLSGAEICLSRDEAGQNVIRILQTDANGIAEFEDLLPGHTYFVTEQRAPDGYQKTDQVFSAMIPAVGSSGTAPDPVQLSIPNKRISNSSSGGGGNTKPLQYTLTYDLRYDSKLETETYSAETLVRLQKAPFRDGYLFTGWYRDINCTEHVTEIQMNSNKTVYAGWKRYTVPELLNAEDHFAYIIGYPDGNVHPEWNVTRGEVATIFFRLLDPDVRAKNLTKSCTFSDVPSDSWYRTAIATMQSMGIINGRTVSEFEPDQPITRAEFAAIATRFDQDDPVPNASFSDISGHWAEEEIRHGATLGWVRGYTDGTFRPDQYITRAETMALINRMLLRLPEKTEDLHHDMIVWPDNADPSVWYYFAVQEATNSHDHVRKTDGVYETWTALNPNEDWKQYERNNGIVSS